MKNIKTFEQFINESKKMTEGEKEDKISKLRGKIEGLKGDLANAPKGGAGSIAKKRMKAEIKKAEAEIELLMLSEGINESTINEAVMTINDFSMAFADFYDFLDKYSKNMDKDTVKHLKEAVKHLDQAWENEADAHGVDYEQYKIKL